MQSIDRSNKMESNANATPEKVAAAFFFLFKFLLNSTCKLEFFFYEIGLVEYE